METGVKHVGDSVMTSLIRLAVPSSPPFVRETSTVSGASTGFQAARCRAGDDEDVKSASAAASAGSAVAVIPAGWPVV
ncbi:hypothetical protein STANM309S_02623 [Streptomyces tanashiensis]